MMSNKIIIQTFETFRFNPFDVTVPAEYPLFLPLIFACVLPLYLIIKADLAKYTAEEDLKKFEIISPKQF